MAVQAKNAPVVGTGPTNRSDNTMSSAGSGGASLFFVTIIMAWRGLGANKLRSFLTMLGVIIGVGAVIIAIAIGQGSKAAVTESIQRLGTNVLTVFPGSQRSGGISFGGGSSVTLKPLDGEAILKECRSVSTNISDRQTATRR